MKINVDEVFSVSDGNGGVINYKVHSRPIRTLSPKGKELKSPTSDVAYKTRKNNRGRWTANPITVTVPAFKALIQPQA